MFNVCACLHVNVSGLGRVLSTNREMVCVSVSCATCRACEAVGARVASFVMVCFGSTSYTAAPAPAAALPVLRYVRDPCDLAAAAVAHRCSCAPLRPWCPPGVLVFFFVVVFRVGLSSEFFNHFVMFFSI